MNHVLSLQTHVHGDAWCEQGAKQDHYQHYVRSVPRWSQVERRVLISCKIESLEAFILYPLTWCGRGLANSMPNVPLFPIHSEGELKTWMATLYFWLWCHQSYLRYNKWTVPADKSLNAVYEMMIKAITTISSSSGTKSYMSKALRICRGGGKERLAHRCRQLANYPNLPELARWRACTDHPCTYHWPRRREGEWVGARRRVGGAWRVWSWGSFERGNLRWTWGGWQGEEERALTGGRGRKVQQEVESSVKVNRQQSLHLLETD